MSKKPDHPMKSTVYLHRPTNQRYVIFHTEGDEHVMEPVSGRVIRVKKSDIDNHEAWGKL